MRWSPSVFLVNSGEISGLVQGLPFEQGRALESRLAAALRALILEDGPPHPHLYLCNLVHR
jgi:hypothetical protein